MKTRLLFLLTLAMFGAGSGAFAINSQVELQSHSAHAKKFLCDRGYCLARVPPMVLEEVAGYLGYVDRDLTRISISPRLDAGDTQLALVHEFAHVYRGQFNAHEETWLNEGLAKFFEYQYSGVWPVSYMVRLQGNPSLNFGAAAADGKESNYGPGGDGYPASFFLVLYLYNHFGQEKFLSKVLRSPLSGWDNITGAIRELIAEGALDLPLELITKESILRHFAVALWLNDPYSARYAFFSLDRNYEPLGESHVRLPRVVDAQSGSMRIQFSDRFRTSSAKEVYAILSNDPVQIKKAEVGDPARVFIYLWY